MDTIASTSTAHSDYPLHVDAQYSSIQNWTDKIECSRLLSDLQDNINLIIKRSNPNRGGRGGRVWNRKENANILLKKRWVENFSPSSNAPSMINGQFKIYH